MEHGVIHTSQYSGRRGGSPQAVYEIAREDPIGAYAMNYITHDCTLIVAYYEIKVDIVPGRPDAAGRDRNTSAARTRPGVCCAGRWRITTTI